jgi:hypothetical protein
VYTLLSAVTHVLFTCAILLPTASCRLSKTLTSCLPSKYCVPVCGPNS